LFALAHPERSSANPMIDMSFFILVYGLLSSLLTGGSFKSERVSLADTARPTPNAVRICHGVGLPPTRTTIMEPVNAIMNAVMALTMMVVVFIRGACVFVFLAGPAFAENQVLPS